jgi:hypothetical protein
LVGEAESAKFAGKVTVSATVVVSVNEPDVPVMVTVVGPAIAAEELAERVSTSVSAAVPAAKLAVTPVGKPDAVNVTAALNPPTGAMVIVLVPVPLWGTETLAGEAESEKFGGTVTVSATVVVAVNEPDVPVIVTVAGLEVTAAVELAVKVSSSVFVSTPAVKLAVTPVGRPEAAKVTAPVNPSTGTIVISSPELLAPWATDMLAEESVRLKPGAENAAAYAVRNALTSSEPQPVASSYPVCTR